jgi:thymidine phosphorylase
MAAATVGVPLRPWARVAAYDAFASNVIAQGGSIDGFEAVAAEIAAGHRYRVVAPASGFPVVDIERVRRAIVGRQRQETRGEIYPDPVGVILVAEDTSPVASGDAIMTVRVDLMTQEFLEELATCVSVSDVPPSLVGEKIGG